MIEQGAGAARADKSSANPEAAVTLYCSDALYEVLLPTEASGNAVYSSPP
jgi:hypothetical protein